MNGKELKQLEQCMDQLADLFDELGIIKAEFDQGKVSFQHKGTSINSTLINNLCQHICDIQRDELAKDEEELPDYYFD